jgi:hypothetical protein
VQPHLVQLPTIQCTNRHLWMKFHRLIVDVVAGGSLKLICGWTASVAFTSRLMFRLIDFAKTGYSAYLESHVSDDIEENGGGSASR